VTFSAVTVLKLSALAGLAASATYVHFRGRARHSFARQPTEGVLFDETYVHHAANETDVDRVILFCDVERPLRGRLPRAANRWLGDHLMRASRSRNEAGERVGPVNVAFGHVYRLRLLGKRLKAWKVPAYYAAKFALIGALVWLVFLV
jgi:beta-hydroxylase